MAIFINTNVSSLTATRQLAKTSNALGKTFQRLSSGFRINSAADDAAGLSISTKMTSQIRGLNQAVRNANDGISLMQVAEGALAETESSLQRIRELAVQAANATNTTTDRRSIQKEISQLVADIGRIATSTEFNGQKLINGSYNAGRKFQIGADAGQTILVTIGSANISNLMGGVKSISLDVSTTTAAGAASNAGRIAGYMDTAISSVSEIRANLGAMQNRFEAAMANLANVSENTAAARSRIMDADIAAETANLTKNAIMQQAGVAVLAQANQQPQIALQLIG